MMMLRLYKPLKGHLTTFELNEKTRLSVFWGSTWKPVVSLFPTVGSSGLCFTVDWQESGLWDGKTRGNGERDWNTWRPCRGRYTATPLFPRLDALNNQSNQTECIRNCAPWQTLLRPWEQFPEAGCSCNYMQVWTWWECGIVTPLRKEAGSASRRRMCFVAKYANQPQNKSKTSKNVKILAEVGKTVSFYTQWNKNFIWHELKGRAERKRPSSQHRKLDLQVRNYTLLEACSKIKVLGHNKQLYIWGKAGDTSKKTVATVKHGGGSIMLCQVFLLLEGLVHFTE